MLISPREVRKFFFAFIFQLSGWALVALSCLPLQVPDVRLATQVPGSMLHRDVKLNYSSETPRPVTLILVPSAIALLVRSKVAVAAT